MAGHDSHKDGSVFLLIDGPSVSLYAPVLPSERETVRLPVKLIIQRGLKPEVPMKRRLGPLPESLV